jgi:hypothetical protein
VTDRQREEVERYLRAGDFDPLYLSWPGDVFQRSRFGVQMTSPARTIADVADIGADPSVVIEATGRALATGLVSPNELRTAVKRRSIRVRQLVARAIQEVGLGA